MRRNNITHAVLFLSVGALLFGNANAATALAPIPASGAPSQPQVAYTPTGLRVTPPDGGDASWSVALALRGAGPATVVPFGDRVELRRDGSILEYVVGGEAGFEHHFRLDAPRAIDLDLVTALTARVEGDGQVVDFLGADDHTVLRYDVSRVIAASGRSLPAELSILTDGLGRTNALRVSVSASPEDYPIDVGLTLGAAKTVGLAASREGATLAATAAPNPEPLAPPSNDECTGAVTLTQGLGCTPTSGSSVEATQSVPPSTCSGFTSTSALDVWYQFVATTTNPTIQVTGTGGFDPIVELRSGACNGTSVTCIDATTSNGTETINATGLTVGATYYIRVYGWAGATGTFNICVFAPTAPSNDTCAGAIPLTNNTITSGTVAIAANDFTLSGTACFQGIGESTSCTAAGRDVVYSFTAPSTGAYSFKVQTTDPLGSGNWVVYTAPTCAAGALTCAAPVLAANRNILSSQYTAADEVWCQSMTAGQTVYVFVDECTASTIGGKFTVEVNSCPTETEPNGTPATANTYGFGTTCPLEGSINPAGDADFYSIGTPAANSRLFAVADSVQGNSADFDMRVTTTADTLEYDDSNNSPPWGSLGPNVEGTKLTGVASYIRMSHFSSTTAAEPYRLYAVVQPPGTDVYGSSATPEVNDSTNNTLSGANAAGNMFFSGSASSSSDLDLYRFAANAGDVIQLGIDQIPTKSGLSFNAAVYLFDNTGTQLLGFDDGATTLSTTPGTGSLTATTPTFPGEAAVWRARYTGVYYAGVAPGSGGTLTGNYLLSIGVSCQTGAQQTVDLALTKGDSPDPAVAGSSLTYTMTMTNAGPSIALDATLTDPLPAGTTFQSITGTGTGGNWSCTVPPVGTNGTITCVNNAFTAGGSFTFVVTVKLNACIGDGTVLTNTATASSKTAESAPTDNTASTTTTVQDPGTCDDGNLCTTNDTCVAGACVGTPVNCDDSNPCTTDACLPASGTCQYTPVVCNDGNTCTDDTCVAGSGCAFTPNDANPCSDGSACTSDDHCAAGACVGSPVVCNDGNSCTDDSCSPATGCVFAPNSANTCSDGNACTVDACVNGTCGCPAVACGGGDLSNFANSTPLAIPDNSGPVTSTIVVSGAGPYLLDLNLQTFITHTWTSDLYVTLRSPAGTVATITTGNGTQMVDIFNGTVWDDQADPGSQIPYTSANIVTNYTYTSGVLATPLVPEEAMGAFKGENPNGTWTITLQDVATSDTGTLNSWNLAVRTLPAAPVQATQTFSNGTPLPIPDAGATVTSTINVSGVGNRLGSLRLTTALPHANSSQVEMTLRSPSGKIATITKTRGGGFPNVFNGTVWDDKADPASQIPYGTTNPNLVTDHGYASGVLATPLVVEEALSAFDGDDPNGTWTITLRDTTAGSTGTLNSWSLDVTTITCGGSSCPVNCDDSDACTADSCDSIVGCLHTSVSCDDGNLCTADSCDSVLGCVHTPISCDDGNVCTADTCSVAAGGCVNTFLDADGDGSCDPLDCAPLDAGAFAVPPEVTGDAFAADKQTYSWTSVAALAGAGTQYGVLRGLLGEFPVGSGASETCLGFGIAGTSTVDATDPAVGTGRYYLVHGHNVCGIGTYGFKTGGPERTTPVACP